ncbi:hypothetical protein THAOC_21985 [Thalassiosira oceanica]|uniref:Uncharacterized protein n=1 Tax=Thalassiosira oceanica TaxID=159749 RepID=K0SAD4_THAOC|nr:hypothetical protein THAOC_21985 [Thalassiosira oceanica]|eukprot:EJK57931.1 hypothetical protein THAOC_21985 [Thalassiosira oceanica]
MTMKHSTWPSARARHQALISCGQTRRLLPTFADSAISRPPPPMMGRLLCRVLLQGWSAGSDMFRNLGPPAEDLGVITRPPPWQRRGGGRERGPRVDQDALEATTNIEEITVNENNQDTLRSLKNDELSSLCLCKFAYDLGDYVLGGSTGELGWLGHFVKKSTSLESFGIVGGAVFEDCSKQSVIRFLDDLRKCNHIKKMDFFGITNMAEIIYILSGAMKSNITHLFVNFWILGVPEATHLFNNFCAMRSLEELCVQCEHGGEANMSDYDMAGCIPSLAACKGMRKLELTGLHLSTKSCAALSAVVPRMAALMEMRLVGNRIDDDCLRLLAQGLSECKQFKSLDLCANMISDGCLDVLARGLPASMETLRLEGNAISDDGLDVLIQGLPASVDTLHLEGNEITLARHLLLLRFKKLGLCGGTLCPGGPRVIAASLANPECRLEELYLNSCGLVNSIIGDKGAATLAEGLRNNQRLTCMSWRYNSNITAIGWNAFSSILCDTSSISATYNSNHTIQSLGNSMNGYYDQTPQDIKMLLLLNCDLDKGRVAATKILQVHRHLDMRPFFGMEMGLLPHVVAWLDRFAESRLDLKLSSVFEFVRAMSLKVTDRLMDIERLMSSGHQMAVCEICFLAIGFPMYKHSKDAVAF